MKYTITKESKNLIVTLDTESGKYPARVTTFNDTNVILGDNSLCLLENGKPLMYLRMHEIGLIDGEEALSLVDAVSKIGVVINSLKLLASPKFRGSVIPTDTPAGTDDAFWIATQAGTYTNFGDFVLPVNTRAEISRVNGAFSISKTGLDLSGYQKVDFERIENQSVNAKLLSKMFDLTTRTFIDSGIHLHFSLPIQSGKIYKIKTPHTITPHLVKNDFSAAIQITLNTDGTFYTFEQDSNGTYADYGILIININTSTNTVVDSFIKIKTIENDSSLTTKIENVKQSKYFADSTDITLSKLISEIYISGYTGNAYLTRIGLNANGSYYFTITSSSTYVAGNVIAQFISTSIAADSYGVLSVVNGAVTLKFIADLTIAYQLCSIKLNDNAFRKGVSPLISESIFNLVNRTTSLETSTTLITKDLSETLSFAVNDNLINASLDGCVDGYYFASGLANVGGGGTSWTMNIRPIPVVGGLKLTIATTQTIHGTVALFHARTIEGVIIPETIVLADATVPKSITLPIEAAFVYYSIRKEFLGVTTIKVTEALSGANPSALIKKNYLAANYVNKSALSIADKNPKTPFLPDFIYTVCNNIVTSSIVTGYLQRNYNAKLFVERLFDFGSDTHNYRPVFAENKLNKSIYSPISDYNGTFNSETTVIGNGDSVAKTSKLLTFKIKNSDVSTVQVTNRSAAATNGKTSQVRVLFIGDSITNKSGADYGAISGDSTVYWSWLRRLFEMDKIDGGNNSADYNLITLGAQSFHDFGFTHNGVTKSNIRSCAEGRSGWDTIDYAENEWRDNEVDNYAGYNYFYNAAGTNCKFSVAKWLLNYRTLDDNGNRLALGAPTLGTRILSDSAYNALSGVNQKINRKHSDNWNVCTPTHIVFQLGTNDASETVALSNIQKMIAEIRLEGFTSQNIGVSFVGAAGAIYPERYEEKYDKETIRLTSTYTAKAKLFCNSYKTLESDANKINFIPNYFCQPTGDGLTMRNVDNMESLIDSKNTFGTSFGNQAALHPNVNAHLAWAYQYYSWIKWTL